MEKTSSKPKASIIFIFITILIDIMGVAIIIPVLPTLIKTLTGKELNEAGLWGGLLISSFAIMQFLFAPLMGELSDRFGRRPILFFSLAGLGLDYVFHAFAPTLAWLFVGRMIAGVFGASHTVATAYIADISTPETKARNFGLIGAAFGLGFFLGPMIGGFCAQWGYQVPFLVAAVMSLLNLMWGLLILPESLPIEKRRAIRWRNIIPGVSLVHLSKYKSLGLFIIAFVLVNLAGQVLPAIWSFFTMEAYAWDETLIGISLGVIGLLVGIVQGGLIGYVVKKVGQQKVIMYGFLLWTIGMIGFAFAVNEFILYAALIPYVLGGVAGPTLQGFMSNSVPDTEQGNLQGALTSMVSLTAVVGPLIYTALFFYYSDKEAITYLPGAPFILAAFFLVVASIFAFMAIKKMVPENY